MEGPNFNEEYLSRLIAGDQSAEQHFIAHFGEHLRIKLRSRLRAAQMIDDAIQETFLRFFREIRKPSTSIQQPARLGAYVNAICNNVLLEGYRSQHKYQGTGVEPPERTDHSWNPDEPFVNAERKQIIREMLGAMPEKERRLLRELFLKDRDKDEICRDFGVDREYLRVMLHRAKNRARAIFLKQRGAGQ